MVIPVHDRNPVRSLPVVTYVLIGLCGAVFLIGPASGLVPIYGTGQRQQMCEQTQYLARWAVVPGELWHGRAAAGPKAHSGCAAPEGFHKIPFLSVLTAMFVHGSWLHLLGNLLFLHVFGDNVETRMGRLRYLLFYLTAGYLATYGYALAHADSSQTLVGASGAISAVLGSYLYLCPAARVTSLFPFLFFLPLRLPAWMVLCFWFVLQWLAAGGQGNGTPGVAYLTHVIGFVFGFLCTWVCFRRGAGPDAAEPVPPRASQGDLQP